MRDGVGNSGGGGAHRRPRYLRHLQVNTFSDQFINSLCTVSDGSTMPTEAVTLDNLNRKLWCHWLIGSLNDKQTRCKNI